MADDIMTSNQYRERAFIRSCLESAPAQIMAGGRPSAGVNGRERPKPQFHQLKQDSLHAALAQTDDPAICKQLCRAANAAAELAWETVQPLLVFPCLFEEMARAVRVRPQHELGKDGEPRADREFEPAFAEVHPDFQPSNPIPGTETDPVLFILSEA